MKTYIRRRDKNNKLIVLFGGWGSDDFVYAPLVDDDYDFILFYNYSADEALILPETKRYDRIVLIGFSLGVWAAEYLSQKTGIKPDLTIAVNGTPVPADDRFGIPLSIFEGALESITEENIWKFYYRMFGGVTSRRANREKTPLRTLKSLQDELRWLYNRIMEQGEPGFHWDYAVSGERDIVFPSENQISYWERVIGTQHIIIPLSHFFFYRYRSLGQFIRFVERKGNGLV